jgi:ADP-ribose pyrophosphatase YjhB (NUDIX family)
LTTCGDHPPVRLLARRPGCENRRFSVYLDHIVDEATGVEVDNFLVVAPHCRRDDLIAGVAVVAVRDGRIALLRPYRHPLGRAAYELPRGFVDEGEAPAAAALRELREETGWDADPADVRPLGVCAPEAGIIRARVALFAIENCRAGGGAPDADEVGLGATLALPKAEVFALLRAMAIEDVTATVALHRYAMLNGEVF